ncbi:hypothetical protein AMYX_22600 [Anaeromyxobacter diazotrophicus]|uniref:Uncharacterized protein n=2 Tax=Anaeromyxobacter diazotrophicus TaxID=2590199 RepID=A0A7I9VN05_9BACT|nr:hypothetical protein AMYX_22600 [Anaeromyxobacter diazotrophicus]
MARRWAGWGAGPSGAGAAGGPGRIFLGLMAVFSAAVAAALWREGRGAAAGVALLAAAYFGLRVAGVIGRRRGGDDDGT